MAKSQFTGTRLALFLVIVGDPRAPKNPSIKRHADAVVKIARGKLEAENRRYQAAMEKARGGVPRSTYQGSASSSGV